MSPPAIQATDLVRSFGRVHALAGVDLCVEAGSVRALLGRNGAGKTTVVRILTTLLLPDAGTATVAGYDVARDPAAVRRRIGVVGQQATVDELLTGRQNLQIVARSYHLGAAESRRRADELLDRFGLADAADRRAGTYSGGMRRRLDLAAGLVADPPVLFLDEPTTGLDPISRQQIWDAVRDLVREHGTTVLLTTQYLDEADELADRITVVDGGRVAAEGTSGELKAATGRARVRIVPDGTQVHPAAVLTSVLQMPVTSIGRAFAVPAPDGLVDLARVVERLGTAGITVLDVGLERPSLDEVFTELTGGPAAVTAPAADELQPA